MGNGARGLPASEGGLADIVAALGGGVGSPGADSGQNLSLADTTAHAFASAVATRGVLISTPAENSATVYFALGAGVTSGPTGKGTPLVPGSSQWLPGVLNANLVYCITGTATQNVKALAI